MGDAGPEKIQMQKMAYRCLSALEGKRLLHPGYTKWGRALPVHVSGRPEGSYSCVAIGLLGHADLPSRSPFSSAIEDSAPHIRHCDLKQGAHDQNRSKASVLYNGSPPDR